MPMRIFDFKCSNNHITERYIDSEEKTIKCPECDKEARRVISGVRFKLDPFGDYPGEAMKWAKQHEKAAKQNN